MEAIHPNIRVMQQFDPTNVIGSAEIIAEDAVFHNYSPKLPVLHGGYFGRQGPDRPVSLEKSKYTDII